MGDVTGNTAAYNRLVVMTLKKTSAASEGEGEAGVGDNIEAATSEKFAAHGHHQILSVVRMALA